MKTFKLGLGATAAVMLTALALVNPFGAKPQANYSPLISPEPAANFVLSQPIVPAAQAHLRLWRPTPPQTVEKPAATAEQLNPQPTPGAGGFGQNPPEAALVLAKAEVTDASGNPATLAAPLPKARPAPAVQATYRAVVRKVAAQPAPLPSDEELYESLQPASWSSFDFAVGGQWADTGAATLGTRYTQSRLTPGGYVQMAALGATLSLAGLPQSRFAVTALGGLGTAFGDGWGAYALAGPKLEFGGDTRFGIAGVFGLEHTLGAGSAYVEGGPAFLYGNGGWQQPAWSAVVGWRINASLLFSKL